MATDFNQDSVLHFIQCNGGRVKNSELLLHFKTFLRDHEDRTHNRELFKKFVNTLAVVKQEEGVSFVVLRKKFTGLAGDVGGWHLPKTPGQRSDQTARRKEQATREPIHRNQERARLIAADSRQGHQPQRDLHVQHCDITKSTENKTLLPSAGIVNNNLEIANFERPIQSSSPYAPVHAQQLSHVNRISEKSQLPYDFKPNGSNDGRSSQITEQEKGDKQPVTLPELNPKDVYSFAGAKLGQPKEPTDNQRKTFCPPPVPQLKTEAPLHHPQVHLHAGLLKRHRANEDDEVKGSRRTDLVGTVWPLNAALQRAGIETSSSSPCIPYNTPAALPSTQLSGYEVAVSSVTVPEHELEVVSALPNLDYGMSGSKAGLGLDGLGGLQAPRRSLLLTSDFHALQPPLPLPPPGYAETHHHEPNYHQLGPGQHPRQKGPGAGLSSSQGNLLLSSSAESSNGFQRSSRGEEWNSNSSEALNVIAAGRSDEPDIRVKVDGALRRAQESKMLSLMHRSVRKDTAVHRSMSHLLHVDEESSTAPPPSLPWHGSLGNLDRKQEFPVTKATPWHHSTGHIRNDSSESSCGSSGALPTSPSEALRRTPVRRLSSKLRMSRSLGANLDQQFPEDAIAARYNRLHLLSHRLSFHPSLSSLSHSAFNSPTHSRGDLTGADSPGAGRRATAYAHHNSHYFHRQAVVPLDSKEHSWMVKGAAGTWTDVYSLFREEPALLTKRDFITGYTVLHWIAKHGDHRVLNTLWYGVSKVGLTLEVDARTTCGYTPLHLAALHGRKKMIRLLVLKFQANVALRDNSGKKAWHYLSQEGPKDLFQILGAPQWLGGAAPGWSGGGGPVEEDQLGLQYSPFPMAKSSGRVGSPMVKRSTSIAAFLKNKTMAWTPR